MTQGREKHRLAGRSPEEQHPQVRIMLQAVRLPNAANTL